ncbi:MAG: hypothetical protein R2729_23475 [Bryobacteraceae bacterium]
MGSETTNASALGLTIGALLVVMCFLVPRRYLVVPLVIAACWLTLGQRFVVSGVNLTLFRIVIAAALVRMIVSGEFRTLTWKPIDRIVTAWLVSRVVCFVLLYRTGDALVNRLGFTFDAVGMYFTFRSQIQSLRDVTRIGRIVSLIILPLAIVMFIESTTGRNYFSVLGGVPSLSFRREGWIRCQGPFPHPILAGTFGAVWLPLFVGLWWQKSQRVYAVLGSVASVLIILTAHSSGPIATAVVVLIGFVMWPMRKRMRLLTFLALATMVALQLLMTRPIWFIFARLNVLSGSTGWHRAHVIDQAIRHLPEWALVGTKNPARWGIHAGDITNQYLSEGLRGGLLTMVLFIATVRMAFSLIAATMTLETARTRHSFILVWALGVTLAAHATTFFSVAYFSPQSMMNWYLTLAFAVAVNSSRSHARVGRLARTQGAGVGSRGAGMEDHAST